MRSELTTLGIVALCCLASCTDSSEKAAKYRAALDKAQLSLADSVKVAEADTVDGIGVRAALLINGDAVFNVGALASIDFRDVRVDIVSGKVLSNVVGANMAQDCPGAISLTAALAAAEAEVGGDAVAIEPDDDGMCNREVKVVESDTVWEVKVGPDGSIVETEEDDED